MNTLVYVVWHWILDQKQLSTEEIQESPFLRTMSSFSKRVPELRKHMICGKWFGQTVQHRPLASPSVPVNSSPPWCRSFVWTLHSLSAPPWEWKRGIAKVGESPALTAVHIMSSANVRSSVIVITHPSQNNCCKCNLNVDVNRANGNPIPGSS